MLFLFLFNLVCNLLILKNILCFLFVCFFFFLLFYVIGVEKWNLFSLQIMILEHLSFCLVNNVCMSHLLRYQPHLLECYYQNCLIGTHMCVHPVSEWSVFLTLQCELFTSCNISNDASLLSAQKWGAGGMVNQMWTGLDRGSQKFPNLCRHPLWTTPNSFFSNIVLNSIN